eukprot:gene6671-13506_t
MEDTNTSKGISLLAEDADKAELIRDEKASKWTQWNDVFWGILFVLHLIVILGLALSYGIMALQWEPRTATVFSNSIVTSSRSSDAVKIMGGVLITILVAAKLSILWIFTMANLAAKLILATFLAIIIVSAMCGLSLFASGYPAGGIVFIIIAGLSFTYLILIRKRIEFAATIIAISCDAIMKIPSTIGYACLILAAQFIWCIIWIMSVLGVATNEATSTFKFKNQYYNLNKCTTYTYYSDFILNAATTLQCSSNNKCQACICNNETVIRNSSCCVSHWWYRETPHRSVVKKNFKRSLTSSFGSICLGSLLVATVRTLRIFVDIFRRSFHASSTSTSSVQYVNMLQRYILCVLSYILRILDAGIEYFNKYAFCYVAIYGYSFWDSS